MKIARPLIAVVLAAIVIVTTQTCRMTKDAYGMSKKPKEQAVPYKRIAVGEYQNFITNWDEKQAVLFALIQTPAQYDALFHPGATMGDKRPFKPEAKVFKKEQILVVARVIAAPENMDKVFEVERVVRRGRVLELYYRFNLPDKTASYLMKNHLAVSIPKFDYKNIIFFENGKQIGELKAAEGQWSVPAVTL